MKRLMNSNHKLHHEKEIFLQAGGTIIEASSTGVIYMSHTACYACSNFLLLATTDYATVKITFTEGTFTSNIVATDKKASDSFDSIWLAPTNTDSLAITARNLHNQSTLLLLSEDRIPNQLALFLGLSTQDCSNIDYKLLVVDTLLSNSVNYYSYPDDPFFCYSYLSKLDSTSIKDSLIINDKEGSDDANW